MGLHSEKEKNFKCFIQWKVLLEKCSDKKLKTLRRDNGVKYISSEFDDYLKSEEIHHERTIPKTPDQNGVAERMNKRVVEAGCSMLTDAKLPHSFLAEAVSPVVFIRNQSPTRVLKDLNPV